VILVMLAGLTTLPSESWWNDSKFIAGFEDGAVWLKGYVPENMANEISF
jgi:membrane protein required for colicin V production